MRLLLLSNVYPSPLHPTKGVFNRVMACAWAGQGHEVSVVCPIAWTDRLRARRPVAPDAARGDGVRATYPTYLFTPRVLRRAYGWFMWRSVRRSVRRALSGFQPDAVIGYWAHPDGRCAVRAAREAGVPAVVMVGGSDVLVLTSSASRRRLVFDVLRDADAVVTVGEDIRSKVIEAGIPSERVHVVRRGVDRGKFSPGDQRAARQKLGLPLERPIALWVGRMTPVKGLSVLIDALERIGRQGEDLCVCLAGGGELRGALEAECRARGLEHVVRFVGGVAHDDLADWYRAADVTVLPSLSEGVPNVLLESMACGTPFVASRVGGIPEIATPGVDTLVPPGDGEALARALVERLQQPRADVERGFEPPSLADAARELVAVVDSLVRVREQRASRDAESPRLEPAAAK